MLSHLFNLANKGIKINKDRHPKAEINNIKILPETDANYVKVNETFQNELHLSCFHDYYIPDLQNILS